MSRILIWQRLQQGDNLDIFSDVDYSSIWRNNYLRGRKKTVNWGNKLWFQGIYSVINTPENEISFRNNQTDDYINEEYDLIIYPMANFFGIEFCSDTTELVNAFRNIKIPVFIIACGVQAGSYDELDDIISVIGTPASRFIEAIYKTGGEFCLRGEFSKEFFKQLGFPSAIVTGCPSLFQMGKNLQIVKKSSEKEFKLIVNGRLDAFIQLMMGLPNSTYCSQDVYADILFDPTYFDKKSIQKDIRFVRGYGVNYALDFLGLLENDRIKMFADMNEWYRYISDQGFVYSFGTKIHGTIMPILAGIPSTILTIDTRTQEMAEFFDIPHMNFRENHKYTEEELKLAYSEADFTRFNETFATKFEVFERFLVDHNIVTHINENNTFFQNRITKKAEIYRPNKDRYAEYRKRIKREALFLNIANNYLSKR